MVKLVAKTRIYSNIIILLAFCFPIFTPEKIYAEEKNNKIIVKKLEFSKQNNLEITLSNKANFKAFVLKNPNRLVVDIENAKLDQSSSQANLPYFVNLSRSGTKKDSSGQNNLRLVFDLNQSITIKKSSFRKIKNQNFAIIIVEFDDVRNAKNSENKKNLDKNTKEDLAIIIDQIDKNENLPTYIVKNPQQNLLKTQQKISINKTPIIVIDAGHGGKDPGTIGDYARTKEKNITLAYAKELKKNLDKSKKYKVFLTRDADFFIPLRQRVEKSRRLKADLFISLHANSIADQETCGFSIYTLSQKSSDKQAELLAQKENRADIIAGVNFANASPEIMKTLIDLSQRDTMNNSARFANIVIQSIKKSEIKILQNSHRFAGFAVLTAPDVASTL
ncbi:MAG: N-acetylmuramoyl-L-alanine amidase, partial [Rickettsiales bacterium]|nr:N-acetylmuramoyl-L-alanine amidase [Rickettsiales bacterium]